MPKVILNGIAFSSNITGLESVTATIRHSDGAGGAAFSYSGELTFYGDAYNVIRDNIILSPTPHLVKIPIIIIPDQCPEYPFTGFIEGAGVEWCEVSDGKNTCSAKASIIDGSLIAEKLACVKNTIIWAKVPKFNSTELSAGEDTARKSRYLTMCVELRPRALAELIMILYVIQRTIIAPVVFVVALIVTVINLIIKAVNTIPFVPNIPEIDFDGNDDTNPLQEFKALLDQMDNLITGCGAKHKAPFIHSYIQNVCDICGLELSSSILEPGEYYNNLMRLDAPAYHTQPGASVAEIEKCYNKQKPNLNGGQLLDEIQRNLNWEWWIEGSVLRIEPAGNVDGLVWLEEGDGTVIKSMCVKTTADTVKAYGVYEYSQDAVDVGSNEVRKDWGAVNDWNTPPNGTQRGAFERTLNYGAALFRKDNQGDSTLPIDKPFYNNSFAFPTLATWERVIIMSKGVASLPKLLIWDGQSAQDNARVQRWGMPGGKYDYNTRMWMREQHPSGATLYETSFEETDNPRNADIKLRDFDMEICLNCELLATAQDARFIRHTVGGVLKTGKIEAITINYGTFTATINGKI